MRIAILGVGGIGAMAAWRLAKAGHRVTALEQFRLDHDLGSSYGDSRIVRRAYPDALYTALMADAYTLWDELQAAFSDRELFVRSGGIYCGPESHPQVHSTAEALASSGVDYEIMNHTTCSYRFPAFALRKGEIAVYEPGMGYARASLCARAAAELARELGAVIREETQAVRIEAGAGGTLHITLQTGETLTADGLIVAAGPWTGDRLAEIGLRIPLVVTRQAYLHFRPERNAADFERGRFPVWIDAAANVYGFPRLGDLPGVKIALHDRGAAVTAETVEREVTEADREAVWDYAQVRFPWLSDEVVYSKVCLYTNTPDEDFIIDRLPGLPNAVCLGGTSGHGFKFTPLLGQIAADLVTNRETPYDLSRFRLNRFAPDQRIG